MKSTDIPNGFVILGQMGKPVLIDFDEEGNALESGTELQPGGWLAKNSIAPNIMALVHTVKGDEQMLIKALLVISLNDTKTRKPITAVELGRAKKLFSTAKEIYVKYIEDMKRKDADPNVVLPDAYKISANVISTTGT